MWTDCLGNQQTDCNCLQACHFWTSGLLDLSLARAYGHPGTTRSTGTRAHGHTSTTPIHGQTETRGDKTSGRRTHRPTQASKTRPHPTQAPMRRDNGRQKGETRRRKGGRTIQHRHTCGKTMGDNGLNGREGETRLREGGRTTQHRHTCGETMGLMGEKGRQDLQDLGKANCKDSGSFTSASNSRQISIYSLQFTQAFSQCGVLSQQSVGSHSQISTIMECAVGQCMHLNTPPWISLDQLDMIHSELKKMQCLLDTVDSPKTVVRTSQFTIQTVSLQSTKNFTVGGSVQSLTCAFEARQWCDVHSAVSPKSHPQWTHQCRHHHQWWHSCHTSSIHSSSGCSSQCPKLHLIGHVISVQSNHFAVRHSEHEVPNKASAVISVQFSARHLSAQCRQCTKSQALKLEDHPSLEFSGFQYEPLNTSSCQTVVQPQLVESVESRACQCQAQSSPCLGWICSSVDSSPAVRCSPQCPVPFLASTCAPVARVQILDSATDCTADGQNSPATVLHGQIVPSENGAVPVQGSSQSDPSSQCSRGQQWSPHHQPA